MNGCVVSESAVGTTLWTYTVIACRTLWLLWVCVTQSRNLEMDVFDSNFKTFGKMIIKNRYVQTSCHPAIALMGQSLEDRSLPPPPAPQLRITVPTKNGHRIIEYHRKRCLQENKATKEFKNAFLCL